MQVFKNYGAAIKHIYSYMSNNNLHMELYFDQGNIESEQ